MSVQTLERTPPDTDRVTWRSVAVLAAVLLIPALAYAATVLLPYRLSDPAGLVEVAGCALGTLLYVLSPLGAAHHLAAGLRKEGLLVSP